MEAEIDVMVPEVKKHQETRQGSGKEGFFPRVFGVIMALLIP